MCRAHLETPLGILEISGSEKGIRSVSFLDAMEVGRSEEVPKPLQVCLQQLQEYFEGRRTEFSLPLDPEGTEFQKRVWNRLLEIPFGETLTYGEQSAELGDVKAIRAVAAANGRNPLAIIIPCHRVIGADGSLTGYAGGLWRKKWLLDHENPSLQTSLF